jgi:hypothetical protein
MALEMRFAVSIQDKNAGVFSEKVSESGRTIRKAVGEGVAPQATEPTTAEIFQGELEAYWDWATGDMDTSMTRPKRKSPSPQDRIVTEH